MSIKVFKDKIVFQNGSTSYTLQVRTSGDVGLKLNGILEATEFANTVIASAQGTVSGYTCGGRIPAAPVQAVNTIDKFPFASDGNATDVGDLTATTMNCRGQSSTESGYSSAGIYISASPTYVATIDKFPFSVDGNATDVGDVTQARAVAAGQSSGVSGYLSGGLVPPFVVTIDKFPFASDGNATDVGDLTQARSAVAGQSSTESGYTSGGQIPSYVNTIDKFPFASDGNATDVGDITQARHNAAGQSSQENGYTSGGQGLNTIDKFPFSSDANATDVGDLFQARNGTAGQSAFDFGYTSGGYAPAYTTTIDKFSFSVDGNATDVGDLTVGRAFGSGQQV
jgi:hypothetical protein